MPKLGHEITKHKLFEGNMGPLLSGQMTTHKVQSIFLGEDQIVKDPFGTLTKVKLNYGCAIV